MGRRKVFEAAGFISRSDAEDLVRNTAREWAKEDRRLKGGQLGDALRAAMKSKPTTEAAPCDVRQDRSDGDRDGSPPRGAR